MPVQIRQLSIKVSVSSSENKNQTTALPIKDLAAFKEQLRYEFLEEVFDILERKNKR